MRLAASVSAPHAPFEWHSGTAKDSEETLAFSAQTGVRPMIEKYPLEKAAEGYAQMMSEKARFRVVLTM